MRWHVRNYRERQSPIRDWYEKTAALRGTRIVQSTNDNKTGKSMLDWLTQHEIYGLLITIAVAVASYYIARHVLLVGVRSLVRRTMTLMDDFVLGSRTLRWISMFVPLAVFILASRYLWYGTPLLTRIGSYALFFVLLLVIGSVLHGIGQYLFATGKTQGRPLKGYVQAINMVIYLYGLIVIAASIADTNPIAIISGLGAVTAVALLVFRDAILNFSASLTITSNDLLRVGDWVEAPTFNANGIVTDIALYTVKVENHDKTISVIPTYRLVDASFRNWRELMQKGVRRMLRSIFVDQTTIRVCSPELVARLEKFPSIETYIQNRRDEIAADNERRNLTDDLSSYGRQMTNVGLFRAYVESYLRGHAMVRPEMTISVRQLQPEAFGLPIEILAFVDTADGPTFEAVQSDILEHLISVLPWFELSIYQGRT